MTRTLPAIALTSIALLGVGAYAEAETIERPKSRSSEANNVTTLLGLFAKSPGFEASFREEKFITLLKAPIKSEGTLHFSRPGQLAKRTLKPQKSVVFVDGSQLSITDSRGSKKVDLDRTPALRPLVDSFVHLLAGDKQQLEENFRITLVGAPRYKLTLEPKRKPLSSLITRIEVEGTGTIIETMSVIEASGDRSVTYFSGVNAERTYSSSEKKRIFSALL